MRILYVAKHDSGGGDDEGAITWALGKLGHTVIKIDEAKGYRAVRHFKGDLLLFHKWSDYQAMKHIPIPKVSWYFDLVDWPDPLLARRCSARKQWMSYMVPLVDFVFCTDGDWAANDETGKVGWVTQGFDDRLRVANEFSLKERYKRGVPTAVDLVGEQAGESAIDLAREQTLDKFGDGKKTGGIGGEILFTGISSGGGTVRESFVAEMLAKYGARFSHIPSGIYREVLAKRVRQASIVVAPDSPVSDRYWSNRVYNVLGLGGFLLHPYCEGLTRHYVDLEHLVYYKDRDHLHYLIEYYEDHPVDRCRIAEAGAARTRSFHTYTHRCQYLLYILAQKGIVS